MLVEVREKIATITINRPEVMNSITDPVHIGLLELFHLVNSDDDVFAIVLTGAGDRGFCAGADVKDMAGRADKGRIRPMGHSLKGGKWLIHRFLDLEKPIVAAINGDAVGLGATLALMCDVTVMSDAARIGDNHVRMGLVAGDGGTLIWPFMIGMNRAKELLLTGRLITAPEAKELGLVNYVVPKAECKAKAWEIAKQIADNAPLAVRWTKAALNQAIWQQTINTHHFALATECMTIATEDTKEALYAFREKRKPVFKGK